jgi:hypothetical protein
MSIIPYYSALGHTDKHCRIIDIQFGVGYKTLTPAVGIIGLHFYKFTTPKYRAVLIASIGHHVIIDIPLVVGGRQGWRTFRFFPEDKHGKFPFIGSHPTKKII